MDRGAWRATVHRVSKSRTRLNDFTFTLVVVISFSHFGAIVNDASVNIRVQVWCLSACCQLLKGIYI